MYRVEAKMKSDYHQRILDSCLREVIGGRTPPDLSLQILQAWAERQSDSHKTTVVDLQETSDEIEPAPVRPLVVVENVESLGKRAEPSDIEMPSSRTGLGHMPSLWLAASLVLAVSFACYVLWTPDSRLAKSSSSDLSGSKQSRADQGRHASGPSDPTEQRPATMEKGATLDGTDRDRTASADAPSSSSVFDQRPPFGSEDPTGPTLRSPPAAAHSVARLSEQQILNQIDGAVERVWMERQLTPTTTAGDAEWCRRLYLRLLGRIPQVDELNEFLADAESSRRIDLVDRLLSAPEYAEAYADHWSVVWANMLVGRTGGLGRSLGHRDGLVRYLRDSLLENKPIDELVFDLIAAQGSAAPDQPEFNGAVNFLLSSWSSKGELAAARVGSLFLGRSLKCAECHNHPTHEWTQEDFWQLAAFFRQMRSEGQRENRRLVNRDFLGDGRGSRDGEIYFERPNGELRVAFPVFPDGQQAPQDGRLAHYDRRTALAQWISASREMPESLANRLWKHFLGHGLVNPLDEIQSQHSWPEGREVPPSPSDLDAVITLLGSQWAAHEYDAKQLTRWIVLSRPFSLSSRVTASALADDPLSGPPAFSRYYTRQLEPEEVYRSLLVAANTKFQTRIELAKDRQKWLGQIIESMGTDGGEERSKFDGGIGQTLLLMNDRLVRQATAPDSGSVLALVLKSKMSFDQRVEHLFLAAVARQPTDRERRAVGRIARSRRDERSALQDIWWALLNSNEFILDH